MAGPFVAQVQRQLAGGVSADVVVEGPGTAAEEATAFLAWLAAHGCGSYTQRAYALGLGALLELAGPSRREAGERLIGG